MHEKAFFFPFFFRGVDSPDETRDDVGRGEEPHTPRSFRGGRWRAHRTHAEQPNGESPSLHHHGAREIVEESGGGGCGTVGSIRRTRDVAVHHNGAKICFWVRVGRQGSGVALRIFGGHFDTKNEYSYTSLASYL